VCVTGNGEGEGIAGERNDRWERGGKSWTGLVRGQSGPAGSRVRPRWAVGFFFLFFFFLFSFSFVSEFCFGFLKMLNYSDLNKIKADLFCSSKSV
jgi:hypothetical protein